MTHFDQQQWRLFYEGRLNGEELQQMEDHLLRCESCNELFLNCMADDDICEAASVIPADFNRRTMEHIKKSTRTPARKDLSQQKRRRLLVYYVAAAAVTLVLMQGGVFQSMVQETARSSQEARMETKQNNLLFTWPQYLNQNSDLLMRSLKSRNDSFKSGFSKYFMKEVWQ